MTKLLRHILPLLALLLIASNAWAGKAKVYAKSDPSEGGSVYVATSAGNYSPSSDSDDATQDGEFWKKQDKTFYLYYKEAANYHFKGWYQVSKSWGQWGDCSANSSSLNGQGQSVTQQADGGATTAEYFYYAIFATVQVTQTPSFSTIAMGNTTTGTLSIKHAHANSVKIEITGEHASDFKINNTTSYSFSSTALGTQKITITFKPTCAGERKANLKITNENGLPELNIPISAKATLLSQTIAWDDVYSPEMFVGGTLNVSATASTGHAITYESSNPEVISVSGNTLTAKLVGSATITATQYDGCTYQTVSVSLTFNVSDKKTPTFWLNGDPTQTVDYLKTEDTRTIQITNVSGLRVEYDANLLSYSYQNGVATIKALDAGVATLQFIQPSTDQIFYAERTFTFYISKYDTNTLTNDLATEYYVDDIIPEIDIYTINNNEVPVQILSDDVNVLRFENGQLKALNAGTATITVLQAETNKWVERSVSKTITVRKHTIDAHINPSTAVWNQWITNPFSISSTHPVTGQVTNNIPDFFVGQQGNQHIALMDIHTRDIQTYYTNGAVDFLITRPEDRKYNALNQTVTLHVAASSASCDIMNDATERSWSTIDNSGDYTIPSGTPDSLFFQAKRTAILGFSNSTNFYAQYRTENGSWTIAMKIDLSSTDTWYNLSCDIPETAKYVRFITESGATGNKHISNVRVTRKKDLTPSESPVVLPVTSIGTPENKTFTLNWSTCADEILLTNSNPHFTLDKYNINPTNNQGSNTIKVTCDATVVGTLRDTIVIYDQTQRIFVPVECVVNDKFIANIKGTTSYSKMVSDAWVADFRFDTCQTTLPSADINAPLYYTIDHDLTGNNVQQPGFENQVISYNPENFTITAHNAGTAVLTFIQQPTASHYTDTLRCTITVSKHDVKRTWKDPVYFNDTIDNYFTTSNIASDILIESQTDTDVARLTNEFNPTSNNSLDLITFNKEAASTTVTVSQAETYYWNGYSEPHTITPIDPSNHVTFTIDSEARMWVFQPTSNEQLSWSNGIKVTKGDLIDANWDDRYVIINFTGIPKDMSFSFEPSVDGTTNEYWYVDESPNGQNGTWTRAWNTEGEGDNYERGTVTEHPLLPTTRYLKLCYSGNYGGIFKNLHVTELNEFRAVEVNNHEVDVDFLNFDSIQVNTSKTMSFAFKYANAGYKVELISTDPHFTINPSSITDIGGENHGTRQIDVTYTSSVPHATNEDAMIIISDEHGHKDTVQLIASAYKLKQTLRWRADFEAVEKPLIPLNGGDISDAAYSTSGLTIKYLSDNSNVIAISSDGTTLIPMGEGEATITATQTGNELWNPAESITKTFVVTDKRLQYIIWNDPLSDLVKSDNNQTITLTAKVYVQTENGQFVESPEQTAKLTYQSADTSIVSVSGSLLTIHSVGKTTLTAHVPATDDFAAATLTVPVIVRPETAGCEDVLLLDENGPIQFFQYSLNEIIKEAMPLDLNKGIPGYVLVEHYGESWDLAIQYYAAEIRVEESTDGGNSWNTITTIYPAEDKVNIDSIPLSRTATHIRFARNSGGQGYQFLQNIKVHPAQFIEAPDVINFGNIHVGSKEEQTFVVSYSNIKSKLSTFVSSTDVVATPSSFGECGEFGTQTIQVFWTPSQLGENMQETITFTDFNSGMKKMVILLAQNIQKGLQQLNWNAPDTIEHCGNIHFPEQTTADLSIKWEVIGGKQYADFVDGTLTLFQNGTIQIKGSNKGSNNYEPFEQIYTFQIAINPIFMGTEDEDWNNTNNWNICRLPYHTETVTIQAPAVLSTHDTIAGITFASNGSLHITSTGGLTVGTQGITGATTDGSNILIDNTPDGAGFLLISPDAPADNKHPYFTMNFTTRAFNEGVPRDETWQYMGAPGDDARFKSIDDRTLIYHWEETKGWMTQSHSLLSPIPTWQGYALTQSIQTNNTYQITAKAIQGSHTINLTSTPEGMKGDNLFVNSFTAPIDITKIDTTDITGEWNYQTFYLFNTGSWNDWQGTNPDHQHDASSPGHYYTIPIRSAQYLDDAQTIVPPMQGVYVHTDAPATITLDYSKHVWKGNAGNVPMRAPHKQDPNFRRIRIQASSENSGADRMYIIQASSTTRGYDNGYDGKNINAKGQVNIYTNEPFGKMEVSCANDIDSMYIGFRAGSDSEYRLTFSSLIGGSIYIKDLEDNSITRMNEGGEYHFQATPNSVNHSRFQILLHPSEITDENTAVEDNHVSKINIWIDNKYLHITDAPANSPATIYAVSGQRITSYIVNTSHYTIPLSSLSNGIYILQIGDQRYKFVCK